MSPKKGQSVKGVLRDLSDPPDVPEASYVRLQFVLAEDISSRLIAWWGQGVGGFSHVDAVLPDGRLLGARSDHITELPDGTATDLKPGVQIRPPNYAKWLRREVVEIPCAAIVAREWREWLVKRVGEQYDAAAIMGFIVGRKLHSPNRWICSGEQFGALLIAGLAHKTSLLDDQVTPDALHFLVTAGLGGKIVRS